MQDVNAFKYWGLSIVKRKAIDFLRSKKREEKHYEQLKYQIHENNDLDETLNVNNKISVAIKNLPFNQQVVLKLFYVENYSLKEISKLLNISVGTAKSRLFYAREKLKQRVKYIDYEN